MRKAWLLGEDRTHHLIDLRAGQVVAQRFSSTTRCGRGSAGGTQLLANLGEQVRAGGEVQHDGVGTALSEPGLQVRSARLGRGPCR